MTEILVLYLCAAILGALLGWSVGASRRRSSAWPLFTAVLAIIGLWRITTYAPEATTDLGLLDGPAAFTRGLALTVVIFGGVFLGWKGTAGPQR